MSIIDEIKLYVKHGKLPIMCDMDNEYFILNICHGKITRVSGYKEVKSYLQLGSDNEEYSEDEIENYDWKIVGQYDLPTILFAVGQKVKVREDLGDVFNIKDWDENKKNMIDKIFKIETIYNDEDGISYLLKTPLIIIGCFRHDWLLPVLEPTRTVDDVLAGLSDEDKEIIMEKLK